ncbi:DUF6555 family protein [Pseudomonas sp. UBA4194]|uniref:DUF6555 family protein n=1 Tax=Pseudomonas sp. UBA4194 TaxID=1947317 RepID=UPI0025D42DF2|nr:DUF6555 family protein [Pseudomonas sp. UBA4194]
MANPTLFIIDYRLHGAEKSFIIRLPQLNAADAWHWASCDAGVGIIPKFGREKIKKVGKAEAEQYGISEVRWRASGQPATAPVGAQTQF